MATARRAYGKLIKTTKSAHQEAQYFELEAAIRHKNDDLLWHLVATGTKSRRKIQGPAIAPEHWIEHFQKLYNPQVGLRRTAPRGTS